MKTIPSLFLMTLFVFLGATSTATAEDPDGMTVMQWADDAEDGDNGTAHVIMILTAKDGSIREREFDILRKDYPEKNNESRYFIEFEKPADVKGMRFLVWDHKGASDDRWMYLPRLRMVRRIAAEDDRGAFVGSDFTYEDISGRAPEKDTHTLLGSEKIGEREAWKVQSVPIETAGVEFAKKISWIDKTSHLILKEEYLNSAGEVIKTAEATEIQTIQGIPTRTIGVVKDLKSGHQTQMKMGDIKYNLDNLDDDQFIERALKR